MSRNGEGFEGRLVCGLALEFELRFVAEIRVRASAIICHCYKYSKNN